MLGGISSFRKKNKKALEGDMKMTRVQFKLFVKVNNFTLVT